MAAIKFDLDLNLTVDQIRTAIHKYLESSGYKTTCEPLFKTNSAGSLYGATVKVQPIDKGERITEKVTDGRLEWE